VDVLQELKYRLSFQVIVNGRRLRYVSHDLFIIISGENEAILP
jgi:hypothetical protein